jgi:hypothetical protein
MECCYCNPSIGWLLIWPPCPSIGYRFGWVSYRPTTAKERRTVIRRGTAKGWRMYWLIESSLRVMLLTWTILRCGVGFSKIPNSFYLTSKRYVVQHVRKIDVNSIYKNVLLPLPIESIFFIISFYLQSAAVKSANCVTTCAMTCRRVLNSASV